MITLENDVARPRTDAELVRLSLAHDRGAFSEIVARHQSLVCALAYSATGSLSRSEDLAQETFVAAWRQLPSLREPERLRAWLCGIARNLIRNAQRRAGRDPAHVGEPIETAPELATAEPSPPEQAISHEEETIMWRALARIPGVYREPLVLYYREHQSVARVAAALDLSEDAVKQRLSRGRVLLQEQVQTFVEGALRRSNPGATFTAGVIAALPALGAAGGAVASVAVGKGSATAKTVAATAGSLTISGAITAVIGLVGGWIGYRMSDGHAQSPQERRWAERFWQWIAIGFGLFVVPSFVLAILWHRLHPELLRFAVIWLGFFYIAAAVPLAMWAWRNHRRLRGRAENETLWGRAAPRFRLLWVSVVTVCAAGLLVFCIFDTNWRVSRLSARDAQALILAHPEARCSILQYQSGAKYLWIFVPGDHGEAKFIAPVNAATVALLKSKGIACPTFVQGRDFEILGWPGRLLFLLATFVFVAGGAALLRRTLTRRRRAAAP